MRIPRSIQLMEESGSVHKYWKCHNNEFLLDSNKFKDLYMNCTINSLKHKKIKNKVQLNAYCIMDNHSHMKMKYFESSTYLSNFMRLSHSQFGYQYNKATKRTGKVANERPKTPYIEDSEASMRVHMYIEANPIRAGKLTLNQLKRHKYSSYMFYAYGFTNEWTKYLTYPDWYLKLGSTLKECQRRYREIFLLYINESANDQKIFEKYDFIGSLNWIIQQKIKIKKILSNKIDNSS